MKRLRWGVTALCHLQNYMFCYISQLHFDRLSQDFYNRDSFDEMIKMRGKHCMLTSKLPILLNISLHVDRFSQDFYNRDSFDETIKISCIWKMFCIILCFLHSVFMHTHIHTYIHTYIHACIVSDNYLFVPNAVLKSMCMLYLSSSLCYMDSICNWHMNIKRSDEVCNIQRKLV